MTAPRRDILLDAYGNRILVGGDYGFADGIQGVKQGVECRVKLFLGEVWTDESQGVPWNEQILIRNPSAIVVKAQIGRAIAATPDVTQVVAVTGPIIDPATRHARIDYTANSTAGTITGTVTT